MTPIPKWISDTSDLSIISETVNEFCEETGITPDDLGMDLGNPGPYKKVGLKDNSTERGFEFETEIICPKCKKHVQGLIVLDRNGLNVKHSEGFTIIDRPICNDCIKW